MFDIGFLELLLISIIGLMVLGPERLPGAIRTASLWLGRLKRSFNNIRTEIEREVGADEIRRQLHNEAIMDTFKDTNEVLQKDLAEAKEQLEQLDYDVNDVIKGDQGNENSESASATAADDTTESATETASTPPSDKASESLAEPAPIDDTPNKTTTTPQ